MARKRFNGIRRRVEGERARFALAAVANQQFTVTSHDRLGDDTGYFIRTREGPVINMYDTGTITVSGNNRHMFGDTELLRMPVSVQDVLIVAGQDNDLLLRLTMALHTAGTNVDTTFFCDPAWMKRVGTARRRGQHIVVLVSVPLASIGAKGVAPTGPDEYFGLGLLVARIGKEHLTVVWDEKVTMPETYGLLGPNLIRYTDSLDVADPAFIGKLVGGISRNPIDLTQAG